MALYALIKSVLPNTYFKAIFEPIKKQIIYKIWNSGTGTTVIKKKRIKANK